MNPNSSYQNNPFDDLMNEPVNSGNPFAMGGNNNSLGNNNQGSSTGYTPKAMDDGKLNDLINPFAVLGLENPSLPKDKVSGPKQASLMEVQQQQQQQRSSMMPTQPWGQPAFQQPTMSFPMNTPSDPFAAFNQPTKQTPQDINNGININPFSSFQAPAPSVQQQAPSFSPFDNGNVNTTSTANNNGFGSDSFGPDPFSGNTTINNNNNDNNNNKTGFETDFADFDTFSNDNKVQENVEEEDDFGITWDSPRSTSKNEKEDLEGEEVIVEDDEDKETESHRQNDPSSGISPAKYINTNRYNDQNKLAKEGQKEERTEGYILARISTRTLLVKEWKKTYWVILKEQAKLLLYRSRDDYLYSPVGQNVKKEQLLTANIRCTEITCKEYSGYGDLYHFTVEELLDYGPILVAKFSTLELTPLRNFRASIMGIVVEQRKKLININSQRSRNGSFVHAERTAREGKIPVRPPQSIQPRENQRASTTANENNTRKVSEDKYAKWGTIDNID